MTTILRRDLAAPHLDGRRRLDEWSLAEPVMVCAGQVEGQDVYLFTSPDGQPGPRAVRVVRQVTFL